MTDIKLPQLGESIAEGTIGQWLVEIGGTVAEDQPLVQVTTDKADIDIPSPVSGVLAEILVGEGVTVDVGTVIARIDETGKAGAVKLEKPAEKPSAKPAAIPAAPEKSVEKKVAPPETKPPAPKPAGLVEPQTQKTALRADEARQVVMPEEPEAALTLAISQGEPSITEEGIPGEEAMPHREPDEQLQPPPEITREQGPEEGPPCDDDMAKYYSPAVMTLAIKHGIDLKTVEGTGRCGRITKKDVMDAIGRAGGVKPAKAAAAMPVAEIPVSVPVPAPTAEPAAGFGTYRPPVYAIEDGDTSAPFTRLRRFIADHMVYSKRTSPHVTTFTEVDMEHAVAARTKNKARIEAEAGVSLTYLHFVTFAAVNALKEFPVMNSVVQADTILTKKRINMGIAVDTERGLMVPVVRGADGMALPALAAAINAVAVKVRDRKAAPDDMAGGTFTMSNPGRKGNLFGTPIISQPQVGVLRMGEIVKRPVVVEVDEEDAIAVHPMMYLSLSYDHRVVDGLTANEFLHRVKELLESGEFGL